MSSPKEKNRKNRRPASLAELELRCQLFNSLVTANRHHHDMTGANALGFEGIIITFCRTTRDAVNGICRVLNFHPQTTAETKSIHFTTLEWQL